VTNSKRLNFASKPSTLRESVRCLPWDRTKPKATNFCTTRQRRVLGLVLQDPLAKMVEIREVKPVQSSGTCNAYFQSMRRRTAAAAARSGNFSISWKSVTSASSTGDKAAPPRALYKSAKFLLGDQVG